MTLLMALIRARLLTFNPLNLLRVAWVVRRHGFRPSGMAASSALRHPNQVAVIDDFGSLTYRELDQRVRGLAAVLRARHGVGPDRPLGVLCRNHRGFLEGLLAASTLSADAILLNTEFPGPQLAQVIAHNPLGCVIHDPEFGDALVQAGYTGPRVPTDTVDALVSEGAPAPTLTRQRGKIVILTSGTTGVPKGAARSPTFKALSGPLTTLLTRIPLRTRITLLVAPPLFHGFGLAYLALSLVLGATLVLRRRFDPAVTLADVERHRVNVLVAVPTMLGRLLEVRERGDLSSLVAVLSAGAPLGAPLCARFVQAFGPRLYNLYGSSETGFGAIATPEDLLAAPGTVGFPPIGTSVRFLGPDDRDVPQGTTGRIFVKSGLVFAGYTGGGNKDIVDGYMSSGDLGHQDEAGRMFVDGRADDMILSRCENVFPLDVEDLLAGHDAVAEVAVVGVSDAEFGQRLKAYVVRREGAAVDDEALRGYLKDRIARYKVPRDIVFLPGLPRTATGKVLKRELAV
jgi:acyl-CoA synthetase (AMP-forming)/AMP-acid ligase II